VQGRRQALLVATGEYDDPEYQRLRAPADEVTELAAVLSDPDIGRFDVRPPVVDQPRDKICEEIEEFLAGARTPDLLLLYLSCHAVLSREGEPYFVASNTRSRLLHATGISKSFVTKVIDDSRCRSILLVLDTCHSGAFDLTTKGGATDVVPHFDGEGHVTLASSSRYQQSHESRRGDEDPEGADSVFTRVLIEGLRTGRADVNQDGDVSLDEMYDYLFEQVRAVTSRQTPELSGRLRGDIWIARNPNALVPLPPELTDGLRPGLDPVIRAAAVRALGELLRGPDRARARSAEALLRELADDDSRQVSDAAKAELPVIPDGPSRDRITASASLTAVASAADAPLAVSGDVTGQLEVWDLEKGTRQAAAEPLPAAVSGVAVTAGSELIGIGVADGTVRTWSGREGDSPRLVATHGGRVNAVATAPDGSAIVSGGDDGDLCVTHVGTGREARRFTAHPGGVSAVSWISPRVVVTADLSGTVAAWDTHDPADAMRPIARWDLSESIRALAFGVDGTLAIGTGGGSLMITRLLPGGDGRAHPPGDVASFVAHDGAVRAIVFAADGRLVSGGMDGIVRAWNGEFAAEDATLTHPGGVRALSARPDGVVISAGADGTIGLHRGFAGPPATHRSEAP
jgi:WD40 repeat protein